MKRLVIASCLSVVLSIMFVIPAFTVCAQSVVEKTPLAQGPLQQINEYFSTQTTTYSDGAIFSRDIISGPPKPPPGYELERSTVTLPSDPLSQAVGHSTPGVKRLGVI